MKDKMTTNNLLLSFFCIAFSLSSVVAQTENKKEISTYAPPVNFVNASESSINSVVHVTTKVVKTTIQQDPFYEFFYGPGSGNKEFKQYGSGSGSGVIVSAEGYIVTNNHVIDNATEIEVILNDNSKYVAHVVGADPSTDIAILKIIAPNLKPITFGNSDELRVGEWVLAVGNPFASQTGSYSGYSFAIPVNLVQKVMRDLIDYGMVQRGFLGIQISDLTQEIKEKNNLPSIKGVFIEKVNEDGSADKVGIKEGDVILKISNKEVNSVASLQEEIGKKRPGDKVSITIRTKKGLEEVKEVVLKNSSGEAVLLSKNDVSKNSALGVTFEKLTEKEKKQYNVSYGVKVKTVTTGKLKGLGVEEGRIVTKVNNEPVETVEQLTSKMTATDNGILLEVITKSGKKEYIGFGL